MGTKISALPTITGAGLATGDRFLVDDVSATATKSITKAELASVMGGTDPSTLARADYNSQGLAAQTIPSNAYTQFLGLSPGTSTVYTDPAPLDLTDPTVWAVTASGVYAVGLELAAPFGVLVPDAGASCYAELDMGPSPNLATNVPFDAMLGSAAINVHLAFTFYVAAGDPITLYVQHDNSVPMDMQIIHLYVQRVA
jgi:hypothetical protein